MLFSDLYIFPHRRGWICFLLGIGAFAFARDLPAVDFVKDIAPIFEARCIECHQPNIKKGKFSLASKADLMESGKVVPASPEKSRLLKIILPDADGGAPEMPEKGPPLSTKEVAAIRQWITDGAAWPEGHTITEPSKADRSWWSLQAIADATPPDVATLPAPWHVNPVDRFIGATLIAKNIVPSPKADRRTLIRRLYIDLLGLPPTLEAIAAFENDTRPDAYERLVDELLASPRYGERWARHWLDIAHYADTHGFERDQRRDNAYRYRDYVIQAFNDDKPYDQFLREQIAGDVIAPESRDAIIATGFLAAGPWDFVGQVETKSSILRRAARADDLDDMVGTVMSATMGLTVSCARCHDHKLDPISQKDYFQIAAVFAGTTRGERSLDPAHDAAQVRLASIEDELAALKKAPIDLVDIAGGGNGYNTGRPYPAGIDVRTGDTISDMLGYVDGAAVNHYRPVPSSPYIDGVFVPDGRENASIVVASSGITIDGLPVTSGKSWDHILNGPVSSQDRTTQNGVDYQKKPHRLLGFHANKGMTFDLDALREAHQCGSFRFSTVVGYGGKGEKTRADYFIFVDGKLRAARRGFGYEDEGNLIAFDIDDGERFLTLIATDGGDGIGFDQVYFGDPQLAIHASGAVLSAQQQAARAQLESEKESLLKRYPPSKKPDRVYATIAKDLPPTHIQIRGNPETPGDLVQPGALSCFDSLPATFEGDDLDEGARRMALAAWITDPANPLTPRVWVNRLWHYHFGKGIVDTPSDFGYGGGKPTHPELLEWLAAELVRQEWSTKAIHRLILTSQAYRQQSSFSDSYDLAKRADPRKIDADNRLLWRMNPRRLEAEALRDSVLQVTGKLNTTAFGGPGYHDFDYEEEYAPKYHYITADSPELWRRSIYRFVVRSTPQPFMTTLDCPNPAVLTPARLTTTTALQSLSLLNNDFMLKQAGYFAERVLANAGDDKEDQVNEAFRLAFGRNPETHESAGCVELVEQHGLTALCRVLLNANEFVHID